MKGILKRALAFNSILVLSACGGGGGSASPAPPSTPPPAPADTTAPVISLNGDAIVNLTLGDAYTDAGASATDNVDGTVNVSVTNSYTDAVGTYTITYTATDNAGNQSQLTRTVIVSAATPPPSPPETPSQPNNGQTEFVVLRDATPDSRWDRGIQAFDQALGYSDCDNNTVMCASLEWETVTDTERGDVLQVTHTNGAQLAGLFIGASSGLDFSAFAEGSINFDIKVISGDPNITFKLDCIYPCTSGDVPLGAQPVGEWVTISYPLAQLQASNLNLGAINTGIVIWASQYVDTVFAIDNVYFSTSAENAVVPEPNPSPEGPGFTDFTALNFGAGHVSDTINPASYRCVVDYGNWIFNAGVVEPAIAGCDADTRIPQGSPTPLFPHISGPAAEQPLASGRWWGSVSFLGEMEIGNPNAAAYITPDPITARITNKGVRMMGLPSGVRVLGNDFLYQIPDPFSEVMDGMAVANSQYTNLDASLYDFSDGSVTVLWRSGSVDVMRATFVHGSPYVYFDVLAGEMLLRTLRSDGGEKGTFYEQNNSLGVWTNVAGSANYFLVTGDAGTSFSNIESNEIRVSTNTGGVTVALLPTSTNPTNAMVNDHLQLSRNVVKDVQISYSVDHTQQQVTVTHRYMNADEQAVTTMTGMQPLHWKHSASSTPAYSRRSARGVTQFHIGSEFSYDLPFVGVLPTLPAMSSDLELATATSHINDFIALGEDQWNAGREDAYWSGKNYGKVAELIAMADELDLHAQRDQLLAWLKAELTDWFTASSDNGLDEVQYFAYDSTWDTLFAMEESFASHQQLNDHHFHYGYLVRAAAEVCRFDAQWCSATQYGPMIELLIRDYAGGRNDDMFPYLRHFDPANGFSWASGRVNFVRGNNNESTSEAANSYGAMILYGMLTGNDEIRDRGIYLHASTAAAYWQYWNNIDGWREPNDPQQDNFPSGYERITTSIIWGDGAVFSTWFSPAFAHILGIQGLPSNTLSLHIGQYPDYLAEYVTLGLSESSNNLPSGLFPDQWRDIWWKIWSMTDADSAFTDYLSMSNYTPEAGETKAHTYYWIKQWQTLGQMQDDGITADYPSAMVFENQGVKHYVVYNFSDAPLTVNFSNGVAVNAVANDFTVLSL